MSKKQHDKQVQRARARRQTSKYDRRAARNKVVVIVMAVLMGLSLVAGSLAVLLSGNDDPPVPEAEDPSTEDDLAAEDAEGPCPSAEDQEVPEPTDEQYDAPPGFDLEEGVTYVATLHTTCGDVELELDTEGSPAAAANFLALSDEGFYDGVPFHRIIEGFMIQGGDPTGTGTGGPGYQFDAELGTAEGFDPYYSGEELEELQDLIEEQGGDEAFVQQLAAQVGYPRGTVAMANSNDPDTQGSQFFIVQGDPAPLDPLYTAFGSVLDGMDVVDDIAAAPVGGQGGVPVLDPVYITGVTVDRR